MRRQLITLFSVVIGFNTAAAAAPLAIDGDGEAAVRDWFDFLAQVNRYSPLEGAYSHGSTGMVLGAGGTRNEVGGDAAVARNELGLAPDADGATLDMPRIWLVKGLPWPVDFGLSGGTAVSQGFSLAAGHVQWTVFEELALPAVAVRLSHGRIFGLKDTTFSSTGVDLVASYGFLRYFTVYGAIGVTRNEASLAIDAGSDYSFMLDSPQQSATVAREWESESYLYGARITIVPPFVAIAAEAQSAPDGTRHYAAKLSLGM
jgi:hypothetical protein